MLRNCFWAVVLIATGYLTATLRVELGRPGQAAPPTPAAPAGDRPNIVLMLADNLGYGELGCYGGGILRGAPTPRIDRLSSEGLRLLNYNVEPQCTPSRSALLTGRFPMRSGTMRVNRGDALYGLTQWEITLAELLSDRGYATGHFGKWHLGKTEGRFPTNQGFDEWYGIPNSSNEAPWTSAVGFDPSVVAVPHILEGRKGEPTRPVEVYDLRTRRLIEAEITRRAIAFIRRHAQAGRPFFAYVPFTLVHYPTLPHPDFAGKTGQGNFADALAELDHRVGQILDTLAELGIEQNTIVIFTSDNGPEERLPWRGWAGPWSGSYFTAMEGSLRVPFLLRWLGKVPAGRTSNEIVHEVDIFPTLARLTGAEPPRDRIIDGVDQSAFLLGKQDKSNREGFPCYVGDVLHAVKWRNWKLHFVWQEYMFDPPQRLPNLRLHNLIEDPRERHGIDWTSTWVYTPMMRIVADFEASLKKEPPIPPGTPDPYVPPASKP
ncbi:MAG: arylsulfatase [Gemmataceae bacterium]|nr:arylsulfatase [Gemmataceae bacterium]MDW8266324.1 arylsulfatase [Gemmataceae bacterium]